MMHMNHVAGIADTGTHMRRSPFGGVARGVIPSFRAFTPASA